MPDGPAAPRPGESPTPADVVAVKSALRRRLRAARAVRAQETRAGQADPARDAAAIGQDGIPGARSLPGRDEQDAVRIARLLLELPEIRAARCVTAYASMPGEPDTTPLRAALRSAGYRVLLPIVLPDGVLDWAEDSGPMRPPPAGIGGEEPSGPRLGRLAVKEADALIIPALAVDTLGGRIGYGGGYYDRALALVESGVPVIAVVHEDEVLDAALAPLPMQPHDVRVHAVVTPRRCLRLLG